MASVVNELVDTFIDEGRTDLVRSVTFNFPVQVIARILGLPREDYPKFQRWTLELYAWPGGTLTASHVVQSREMMEWFTPGWIEVKL